MAMMIEGGAGHGKGKVRLKIVDSSLRRLVGGVLMSKDVQIFAMHAFSSDFLNQKLIDFSKAAVLSVANPPKTTIF